VKPLIWGKPKNSWGLGLQFSPLQQREPQFFDGVEASNPQRLLFESESCTLDAAAAIRGAGKGLAGPQPSKPT
jgi:hypothetical protein